MTRYTLLAAALLAMPLAAHAGDTTIAAGSEYRFVTRMPTGLGPGLALDYVKSDNKDRRGDKPSFGAAGVMFGLPVPTLLRLGAPNVLVMLAQAGTGLVETYFIGQLGTDALAGMALVFPVVMLMQMTSAGAMGGGIASANASAAASAALLASAPALAQNSAITASSVVAPAATTPARRVRVARAASLAASGDIAVSTPSTSTHNTPRTTVCPPPSAGP